MTHSRNYSELTEAWTKWRDASGRLMKSDYASFVELSNKAVSILGMFVSFFYSLNYHIRPNKHTMTKTFLEYTSFENKEVHQDHHIFFVYLCLCFCYFS